MAGLKTLGMRMISDFKLLKKHDFIDLYLSEGNISVIVINHSKKSIFVLLTDFFADSEDPNYFLPVIELPINSLRGFDYKEFYELLLLADKNESIIQEALEKYMYDAQEDSR